ncbi:MAG: [protein-PII] uridylyltransferase [Planctomycetota bacterium]|nr:[protein-PII] uridylyltransferase [Planctomycetota bacterium]
MASGTNLRPPVLAAQQQLQQGRDLLRQQHDQGSPGIQVCARLTELTDTVVLQLFQHALEELFGPRGAQPRELLEKHLALVAHAGYGRRDMAPFSDVDLMILYRPAAQRHIARLAERLVRDICDTRLILGQSVRTPSEAITLARQDPQILTSLTDSRHLAGEAEITHKFLKRLRLTAARRAKSLLPLIDAERREERQQFGETVYLLEPNVKRSRGGLRDIQLVRWIGFCSYGTNDPDGLYLAGALDQDERDKLREATEYLLRIRNELHFHADKAQDRLDRAEQLRLAGLFGFEGQEGLMPVEQFMQEYFRFTRSVRYISARFRANAYRSSRVAGLVGALLSHRAEKEYRVGPYRIVATAYGMQKLRNDLSEALRLAELATLYDKRIGHETWEAVREAAAKAPDQISLETADRFLSLLSRPPQLFRILNRLHQLEVLEKFIPEFRRARGLLQFNEYHKYTVDEHCLRAVQSATSFAQDQGPLGEVYASIKQKHVLHLALLLHDLGKGYTEDHSEVGRRIATDTAARLGLPAREQEKLEFLVHKHLLMTHLALRRDLNDEQVVLQLALEVGSPDVLRMLYILSAADLASVGPSVLNDWKVQLLTQLFQRTMERLSSEDPLESDQEQLARRRRMVTAHLQSQSDQPWYADQVAALPPAYLRGTLPETIAAALTRAHGLANDDAVAWGNVSGDRGLLEFVVCTYESITTGIFHKLTGALTGAGLEILSAQINTLARGLVLDRFHVVDAEYASSGDAARIDQIANRLVVALKDGDTTPRFRQLWHANRPDASTLSPMPTRVLYDNATSKDATILEIFAPNRTGLLYAITRALYEQELSVTAAKIGTHLDQVVDVFYVNDSRGAKVESESRLEEIRSHLLQAVEQVVADSAAS